MNGKPAALGVLVLSIVGCASSPPPTPAAPAVRQEKPLVEPARPQTIVTAAAPIVALVEPYLVAVSAPVAARPPSLGGRILPSLPSAPIEPIAPAKPLPDVSAPTTPPPKTAPAPPIPKRTTLSPAIVKLFQDERAHSVDDARRRLTAATTRATQSATEAKRQWGFVKDGFVAQKQAENADAVARDAASEQADAQKSFDEAQQRQRDAKRDIEAALHAVAETPTPFSLAQFSPPAPTYQPVLGTYRLSVLGTGPVSISVQNGTVVRRLEPESGEAGSWLVRCPEPTKLRVGVGSRAATVIVHGLPPTNAAPPA